MRSKIIRIIILMIVDAAIIVFSSVMPLALRFGIFTMDIVYLESALECIPVDIAIAVAVLAAFKLYNRVFFRCHAEELLCVQLDVLVHTPCRIESVHKALKAV